MTSNIKVEGLNMKILISATEGLTSEQEEVLYHGLRQYNFLADPGKARGSSTNSLVID